MTETDIRFVLAERAFIRFEGDRRGDAGQALAEAWEAASIEIAKAARARGNEALALLETVGRGLALMAAPVVELEHEGAA